MTCLAFFRRGQITIFILLLGLLGLTVGMSAASRSLSDLKQATYTETGTKALAGAEAGLQYGLAKLNANPAAEAPASGCGAFNDISSQVGLSGFLATNGIRYRVCTQSQPNFSDNVNADDVMEVDVSKVDVNVVKKYRIAWDNAAVAIEVAYLDSNFSVSRYAFGSANNFSSTSSAPGPTCGTTIKYVDIPSTASVTPGLLLRVKPMFGSANIYICGLDGASPTPVLVNLNANYYTTEVIATTTGGTVKRLSSKKNSNGLPSAFDNALFSGGDIVQN